MRLWLAVCCFLIATSFYAVSGTAQLSELPPSITAKNEEARENLEQRISVNYYETCFKEVVADLAKQLSCQFIIDESARENSLHEETFITFSIEEVRGCSVLQFLMKPWQCTYHIEDGIVVVLSEDAALDNLNRMVVNCRSVKYSSETLCDMLQAIIDPDSWEENGGSARLYPTTDELIITQTDNNLREIRDLLFVLDVISD